MNSKSMKRIIVSVMAAVLALQAVMMDRDMADAASKLKAPGRVEVSTPNNPGKKATVRLTWKASKGAKSYRIYAAKKKAGAYKLVKEVKKTSYKKKYPTSRTYFFKVSAVKSGKESKMSEYVVVRPGKSSYNCHSLAILSISTQFAAGKTRGLSADGSGKLTKKYGLRYKSSNTKVIKITKKGKSSCRFKGLKKGKSVITVYAPNGMRLSKTVRVTKGQGKEVTEKRSSRGSRVIIDVEDEDQGSGSGSSKPSDRAVPNVIGMKYQDAEAKLLKDGFAYMVHITKYSEAVYAEKCGDAEPGLVLAQKLEKKNGEMVDVKPGTVLPWGTKIHLETIVIK